MQYPVIDLITQAYINNGWTGLDIPQTITYEPIQLGSGDPSPTNVRPILPATILNIGGNDVPVYGGTLDVTTGVLTVDKAEVDLGTLIYGITDINRFYNVSLLSNFKRASTTDERATGLICSSYKPSTILGYSSNQDDYSFLRGQSNTSFDFVIKDSGYSNVNNFKAAMSGVQLVYELNTPITYQLTQTELENAIGIKDDIAHRLKLPLPHYFPHPVIDALQRAAAGTQTPDDTEILQHYLTPLGIGGI